MEDNPYSTAQSPYQQAVLPAVAALLVSFGVTNLLMGIAYMRDLDTLRRVPDAVWQFVCGVPTDNEAVLPLIIGVGSLTLVAGVVVYGIHWLRRKRAPATK